MEVPENEEKQHEDHHNGGTEIFPCCGKNVRSLHENGFRVTLNIITKIGVFSFSMINLK